MAAFFASLYGTIKLLDPDEQARIQGLIINKFRGDLEILRPGLKQLETLTGKPVVGVAPYVKLDLDDEDSLSERLEEKRFTNAPVQIVVIRLPIYPTLQISAPWSVFQQLECVTQRHLISWKKLI